MTLAEKLARLRPGGAWRVVFGRDGSETVEWKDAKDAPTAAELLSVTKDARLRVMQEARDAAMEAGYLFGGNLFHSDKDSIRDVLMALSGAQMAGERAPASIRWKLKERKGSVTHVSLNLQQLGQLFEGLTGNMLAIYAIESDKMAEILAATTEAAVNAVNWPA